MPETNQPKLIDQLDRRGHHMAIFEFDGKYGLFPKANVEYRPDYLPKTADGKRPAASYFTIAELEADIAFRNRVLQKMYRHEEMLKLKFPSPETNQVDKPAKEKAAVAS